MNYRNTTYKLKSRLDYCLSSPSLIPYINNISHLSHNYMNTDHASVVIDLDFTNTSRGKGIFRSPPNAHNDLTYTRLIKIPYKNQFLAASNKTTKPTFR